MHELSELLAERVPGTSRAARHLIDLCLHELLQNVFEWAESPIGCIIQSRWHAKEKNLRLAIADAGNGIPASLRRESVQNLQRADDREVVEAAVLRLGLTARVGRAVEGLG